MSIFTPDPVQRLTTFKGSFRPGMSVEDVTTIMNDPVYVGLTEKSLHLAGNRKYDSALKSKETLYLQYTPFSKDVDKKFVWFQFSAEKNGSTSSLVLKSFGTKYP
ncbi:hypothetical protein GGH94_001928 [Coemansia aciculifera]|uniref:Uncharacterized protein n=1 Tax=Coemansia aciculifera TaxID=417176 RepID=A0A9W8IKS7_9FUNG|nr:hypothetical protein GGH94_001928 [Coemansia aciculifera]KAJ2875520.1 hypothetical protein GGH93_001539 [Coemansia aciculifera]KAJ2880098.1 hypothetical protein H4R27_004930 [Coemansia aciculifera]